METLRGKYYEFAPDKYEARYWNANGYGCAVVASIGHVGDWAAYIGGCDPKSEEEGLRFVATHGVKLSESDARYFFPDLDLFYRP
jgi:hypothetical protein